MRSDQPTVAMEMASLSCLNDHTNVKYVYMNVSQSIWPNMTCAYNIYSSSSTSLIGFDKNDCISFASLKMNEYIQRKIKTKKQKRDKTETDYVPFLVSAGR